MDGWIDRWMDVNTYTINTYIYICTHIHTCTCICIYIYIYICSHHVRQVLGRVLNQDFWKLCQGPRAVIGRYHLLGLPESRQALRIIRNRDPSGCVPIILVLFDLFEGSQIPGIPIRTPFLKGPKPVPLFLFQTASKQTALVWTLRRTLFENEGASPFNFKLDENTKRADLKHDSSTRKES